MRSVVEVIMTLAPAFASIFAIEKPIPVSLPHPVTIATLSLRLNKLLSLHALIDGIKLSLENFNRQPLYQVNYNLLSLKISVQVAALLKI